MKVYYNPEFAVEGGPCFNGPAEDVLATNDGNDCAMQITFSYQLGDWVIADHLGHIMAQGDPGHLLSWMNDYMIGLQEMINRTRHEDRLLESDRKMGVMP